MNSKWLMFKNYMHNELHITKEDIHQWINEAVQEQAERMIKNEFSSFNIHQIVKKMVTDDKYFGSESLKKEIRQELTNQLSEKILISIKN